MELGGGELFLLFRFDYCALLCLNNFPNFLKGNNVKVKVKQSRYMPGVGQRVPGS